VKIGILGPFEVRLDDGAVADLAAGTNYAQVMGVALTAAASSLVTILIR